ncbi:hypothetical protein IWW36_001692 [Coemansia brasiliensis]|uniref:Uncharacterized protein n=1 Tax=Coemansia brasiliensis TaxID=2650707 RepID=A0A9W8IHD0_9FUNG|nr:hypothetical protein IWW36_001692 [Coemansia brasiliensis]
MLSKVTYGYLRGTFGLPYGGYCIRPESVDEIVLQASNEHQRMFCIVGRYSDVQEWMEQHNSTVLNQSAMEATFTHELVVEVFSKSSPWTRMIWGLDSLDVQLVIRIARVWDRQSNASSQFHPLLKLVAPSGISLKEVCDQLHGMQPEQTKDITYDKELLNRALARVSTRGSADTYGSGSYARADSSGLPPYEYHRRLPPPYHD